VGLRAGVGANCSSTEHSLSDRATAKTACERADSAAAAPNPSLPLAETDDAVVGEDGVPSIPPELAVSTPPETDPAAPSTIAQEQAPGASHRGLVEVIPGDPRFRHRHTEEQVGRGERGGAVGLWTKAGFSANIELNRRRSNQVAFVGVLPARYRAADMSQRAIGRKCHCKCAAPASPIWYLISHICAEQRGKASSRQALLSLL